MHSFPANFITKMLQDTGEEWRTLLEIEAASTLRYSDQKLTVSALTFSAMVKHFGEIQDGRTRIELYNIPRIDDQIKIGQIVTIYFWIVGLVYGDKAKLFKGTVGKDLGGGAHTLSFTCNGMGEYFDKKLGQPLSDVSYPNADPDDVGKIMPIVYGDITDHRCLAIDAGGVSTLKDDLSSGASTIYLTDVSRFPTSGTVAIGGEEDITYTGKSGNSLTGVNGVTYDYTVGAMVVEVKSTLKYLVASHPVTSITNPRILPYGLTLDSAVAVAASGYSVNINDSGIATITLTDLPLIREDVAIAVTQQPDQPITTQPIVDVTPGTHDHVISQQTISMFMDTNSNWGFSSVVYNERIVNGKFTESGSWDPNLSNWEIKVQMSAYAGYSGNLVQGRIKARLWRSTAADFTVQVDWYVNGGLKESIDCVLNFTPVTYTGAWQSLSGNDWADFLNSNSYLTVSSSSGIPSGVIYGNELWLEIRFTPLSPNRTLTSPLTTSVVSNLITDAAIGGNSVADTMGGVLIADVEGWQSGGLVEKPWDVIQHLIENYSNGAATTDIDVAGTFFDAKTYLPSTWKFGFAITTPNMYLNSLLERLAIQTWCKFRWGHDGKARLERIKISGTSIRTLNTASDSFLSGNLGDINRKMLIEFKWPDLNQLANKVIVQYLFDPTIGDWVNPDAYNGITEDSNSDSISEYGERQKTWLMWAVKEEAMAQTLRDNLLSYHKLPRRAVAFPTDWTQLQLQSGDLLDLISQQTGISGLHRITDVSYDMPMPIKDRGLKVQLTLVDLLKGILLEPDASYCIVKAIIGLIHEGHLIIPDSASCIMEKIDPTVLHGSLIATSTPVDCITVSIDPGLLFSSTIALPAPLNCITDTQIGLIHEGQLAIPTPVSCLAATTIGGIILSSTIALPAPAGCVTAGVDPDLLDVLFLEPCDSLSGYTIQGTELAEVSPPGQFHLLDDSDTSYIDIYKDWSEIPFNYTFEMRCIFDQLVSTQEGADRNQAFFIFNGRIGLLITFAVDGIYVFDGDDNVLLSGSSTYTDENWHTWKFEVTSSSGAANAMVKIYRDEVLLYSFVDCSYAFAANDGRVWIINRGISTDVAEMYINWYTVLT